MGAAAEKTDLWNHIHDLRWKKLPGGCKPTSTPKED